MCCLARLDSVVQIFLNPFDFLFFSWFVFSGLEMSLDRRASDENVGFQVRVSDRPLRLQLTSWIGR